MENYHLQLSSARSVNLGLRIAFFKGGYFRRAEVSRFVFLPVWVGEKYHHCFFSSSFGWEGKKHQYESAKYLQWGKKGKKG
jgi:hypothetical protein